MIVDPESKALWDELKKAPPLRSPLVKGESLSCCCIAVMKGITEGLKTCTIYEISGNIIANVKINYCPECGRRLR